MAILARPPAWFRSKSISTPLKPGRAPASAACAAISSCTARPLAENRVGSPIGPCQLPTTCSTKPRGASCTSCVRKASFSGNRLAICAMEAKSRRSAISSPRCGLFLSPVKSAKRRLPPGHCRPSSAWNCRAWVENSTPPSTVFTPKRPDIARSARASSLGLTVTRTPSNAKSAVAPTTAPRDTSTHARKEPAPWCRSTPRSAYRRNCARSI